MARKPPKEPITFADGSPAPRDGPRDWWRLSVQDEEIADATTDPEAGPWTFIGPDPAHTGSGELARFTVTVGEEFSRFNLEIMRPDPLILPRVTPRGRLRKSDFWEFEFEGRCAPVNRQRAIIMLLIHLFRDEMRRWVALHYLARTSPVLVRCARGDAPGNRRTPVRRRRRHTSIQRRAHRPPVRRLDRLDLQHAAAVLYRDLHLRDVKDADAAFVRDTLSSLQRFLAAVDTLPQKCLTRSAVDRALGLIP